MAMHSPASGRGFDSNYKRGAIMGLTVAEAFILLSFCLLLLFTWWQVDTEDRNERETSILAKQIVRMQAESAALREQLAKGLGDFNDAEKAVIIAGLSDGTFEAAKLLRDSGFEIADRAVLADTSQYSRFMREDDLKRLMKSSVKLAPDTRLSLADAVEVTNEAELRAALARLKTPDDAAEQALKRFKAADLEQARLNQMLEEQLGETIRKAGGSIDARGTITLPQAILFESNADKIKDPKFLTELCAPWLETLRSANLNISELKIEGHASSEGPRNYSAEQSYLYNLDLSQRRAQNALTICLGSTSEPEAQAWARDHLAAVGYSSARLITNIDGDEDRDASRRVMFSVALNQERLLDEIKKDLSGSSQPMMSVRGPARIIDGDTIEISGTSYRLSGIDAPEMGQICVPKIGEPFDCGAWAHDKLTAIVAGREVQCKATEVDRYQRPIATCWVGDTNLSQSMVLAGLAVPFEAYSNEYVPTADVAKLAQEGLWGVEFEMPWDYRKTH